jgi:hypothetical protein
MAEVASPLSLETTRLRVHTPYTNVKLRSDRKRHAAKRVRQVLRCHWYCHRLHASLLPSQSIFGTSRM